MGYFWLKEEAFKPIPIKTKYKTCKAYAISVYQTEGEHAIYTEKVDMEGNVVDFVRIKIPTLHPTIHFKFEFEFKLKTDARFGIRKEIGERERMLISKLLIPANQNYPNKLAFIFSKRFRGQLASHFNGFEHFPFIINYTENCLKVSFFMKTFSPEKAYILALDTAKYTAKMVKTKTPLT